MKYEHEGDNLVMAIRFPWSMPSDIRIQFCCWSDLASFFIESLVESNVKTLRTNRIIREGIRL